MSNQVSHEPSPTKTRFIKNPVNLTNPPDQQLVDPNVDRVIVRLLSFEWIPLHRPGLMMNPHCNTSVGGDCAQECSDYM